MSLMLHLVVNPECSFLMAVKDGDLSRDAKIAAAQSISRQNSRNFYLHESAKQSTPFLSLSSVHSLRIIRHCNILPQLLLDKVAIRQDGTSAPLRIRSRLRSQGCAVASLSLISVCATTTVCSSLTTDEKWRLILLLLLVGRRRAHLPRPCRRGSRGSR